MNILHNVWTVLCVLSTIGSASAFIYVIYQFTKKAWGHSKVKAKLINPYKRILIVSASAMVISVLLFYVFGGFESSNKTDTESKPHNITASKLNTDKPSVKKQDSTLILSKGHSHNKSLSVGYKKDAKEISKPDTSKLVQSNDNSVTVQGNDNHLVGGTGNTIGVNGDEYIGIKQRHLNDVYKKKIGDVIPPNTQDTIIVRFNSDKESRNFKDEILEYLRYRGYKNIIQLIKLGMAEDDDIVVKRFAGKYIILVFPESNVNQ